MKLRRNTKDWKRFWSKVKRGPRCWEWQVGCTSAGYGSFSLKGRTRYAHRVSYAMGHDIPKGLCVLHKCDKPPCVRPSHLFLGTKADNVADKVNKGRQASGVHTGSAKLTEAEVKSIRCDPRILRVIAKQYKVDQSLIGLIKQRKIWKHIE